MWQYVIRHKVEKLVAQNLPYEYLQKITVSRTDKLDWEKPQKDFWYKGYLYDVVRMTQSQDSITYYCLQDLKETQLLTIFAQKDKKNSTHTHSILLWDFVKKVVLLDNYTILLPSIASYPPSNTTQLGGHYLNQYAFLYTSLVDFPPEI